MAEDVFERIKALLEVQETFPLQYMHKFLGKNTPEFKQGVLDWEKQFEGLTKKEEKTSQSGSYLSLTYEYTAWNAENVVALMKATQTIPDLKVLL